MAKPDPADAAPADPDPVLEEQVEIAAGATVLAAPRTDPVPTPALYGFEEEPSRESNNVHPGDDLPAPPPSIVNESPAPGVFVGVGISHIATGGVEWLVDETTGFITGPAT